VNFTILRFDSIGSTNEEALREARVGAPEGLCIMAREQTAGRGRQGRSWVSEKDAGIYCSLVLRPKIELSLLPLITLMTAVAVHDALEKMFPIECDIKWVNDILVNEKKICGILTETAETEQGLAVIVGIGINLKNSNFPPEIAETTTSIEKETGIVPQTEAVLQGLIENLQVIYQQFTSENGDNYVRREWIKSSGFAFGKTVKVKTANETIVGTTRGIEFNGALRVETQNGEIRIIHAGDVEQARTV
jgi:BirA family biotin operon repressor/biotin-[acetyl-CoA-carboxylase] ligase